MLFLESRDPVYIKNLAAKQDVIEKLKRDLNKAGIKYDSLGSTKLAIYNNVTRATPIYTLVATNFGGFDIIDDSLARLKSTIKPEDAATLFANYNDRGTVTSLSKIQRTITVGTGANQRVVPNNSFESNYFEMPNGKIVAKKHYFTGIISVISSEDIRKADDGTVMYGHLRYEYSGEEKELVLASVEILENGTATTYTSPKKRELKANPNAAREWFNMAAKYDEATTLAGDQLYKACLDYLLTTFDSTTVNAAVKGGKLKYVIEPAEKLQNALTAEYDDVTSNLDEVENTNAENPIFVVKPCEGITLRIVMTRPAPGEKANKIVITNTDKTLLFNDIKANNAEINNPDYRGIKVATIITNSERDAFSRKINFDLNVDDVIEAIDNYVSANQEALRTAIPKKAEAEANSAKYNSRLAANREKLNIQRARDDKRAQKLADREAERIAQNYKPGTIKKAAETLWSSDKEYDDFLNSLVDL